MISLNSYILVSFVLFMIGALGIVLRKNIIISLMCIELMLNAINILLVAFSHFHNNLNPQVMVLFIMIVAACEAAVGLTIIISIFRNFKSVKSSDFTTLKG